MAGVGAKAPAVVTTTAAVVAAVAAATTTVAAATPSAAVGAALGMVVAGAAGAYMGRGHAGMRQRMNEVAREAHMYTTPHPTTSWNAQPHQLTCAPLSRDYRESGGVPMHYDTMHALPSFFKNVFNVFNYNYNIIIADTHFIP